MTSLLSRLAGGSVAPPAPAADDPPPPMMLRLPTLDGLTPRQVPEEIDAAVVRLRTQRKEAQRPRPASDVDADAEIRTALASRVAAMRAKHLAGEVTAEDVAAAEALLATREQAPQAPSLALLADAEYFAKERWRQSFNETNADAFDDALTRLQECWRYERDLTAALRQVDARRRALEQVAYNLRLDAIGHTRHGREVSTAMRISRARDAVLAEVTFGPEAA